MRKYIVLAVLFIWTSINVYGQDKYVYENSSIATKSGYITRYDVPKYVITTEPGKFSN